MYAVVADVELVPRWQPDVSRLECLQRDEKGRPELVYMALSTKIRETSGHMKVEYDEPHRVMWRLVSGDVRAFTGSWTLKELSADQTRATYETTIDFGGKLGLLMRGPAASRLHGAATSSMPQKLKSFVETYRVPTSLA